jgi:tRNA 2-thiouridine synthesizing protein A
MAVVADRTLDCVGLFCPLPILKTREALKSMMIGQVLEMTSDDPASEAGHELVQIGKLGPVYRFVVRKTR